MEKLVIAFCLLATPAAAQSYQPPDNERDQHDRDRSEWRQEQNRQDDEQRRDDRDHDDEPDVVLIATGHHFRKAGGTQMQTHGAAEARVRFV